MRCTLIVVAVLAIVACGDDDRSLDGDLDATVLSDAAIDALVDAAPWNDPTNPRSACAEAPTLGAAGTAGSEAFEVSFVYRDGWSVGEPMTFQIADDVVGVSVTVDLDGAETGLTFVQNNDVVLLDVETDDPDLYGTWPFYHVPVRSGSLTFPMHPPSRLAEGCLTLTAAGLDDLSGRTATMHVATKRTERAAMDVHAVIVGETVIGEAPIREAFRAMGGLLEGAGAGDVGEVSFETIDWPSPFVDSESEDMNRLRASVDRSDPGALIVYFIQDFIEDGTAGIAAGIPGPVWVHGTSGSGVVLSVDNNTASDGETIDVGYMSVVLAHEIAHQLGLFHSSEAEGDGHDILDDTPECTTSFDSNGDGFVDADECPDGGRNFMFWGSADFPQDEISESQAMVLRASPVMR